MNQHTTLEKMKQLRLFGMATLYQQSLSEHLYQDYTLDQFTTLLVDQEWEERQNRRIKSLLQHAGFKLSVSLHNIDYASHRKLDKNQFETAAGFALPPSGRKHHLYRPYRSGKKLPCPKHRGGCLPDVALRTVLQHSPLDGTGQVS